MIALAAIPMAQLQPPPAVVPCGTRGILIVKVVDNINNDDATVPVSNVSIRLTVNGVQLTSPTEAGSGKTAFSIQSLTADVIDATTVTIEYQAPCDAWRRVDFPAIPAYNTTRTQRIDLQRIGYELECADVKLGMDGYVGDTYGFILGEMQQAGYNGLPLVKLELEERKATEDPKIELMTAPLMLEDLANGKRWLTGVADACGGKTIAGAVAAAPAACDGLPWQLGAHAGTLPDQRFTAGDGARLVQVNVDLYLDQLHTCPDLMKTMMRGMATRPLLYDQARACTTTLSAQAPMTGNDARSHVAGLLTYALYTALLDYELGGVADTLGKDRAQPLVKTGVDDLARRATVLTAGERVALFGTVARLAALPAPPVMVDLCRSTTTAGARPAAEASVRASLERWFLTRRGRYPADTLDPQDGNRLSAFGTTISDNRAAAWNVSSGTGTCGGSAAGVACGTAIAWDADRYTCPACGATDPSAGDCAACAAVPALDAQTWSCPGCGRSYLAAARPPLDQCCSTAVTRDPDVFRCQANQVHAKAGPCCHGTRVKIYVCAKPRCGQEMAAARGPCPGGCNVSVYRPLTRYRCPGCLAVGSASGNCNHTAVRRQVNRWTCPRCRAAYTVATKPAGDLCVHTVVADPPHWTCGTCRKGFAALPVACVHTRVLDPPKATCPACHRVHHFDPQQSPSGKPLTPRCVNNRAMVVGEVRKNDAAFNTKYFHEK